MKGTSLRRSKAISKRRGIEQRGHDGLNQQDADRASEEFTKRKNSSGPEVEEVVAGAVAPDEKIAAKIEEIRSKHGEVIDEAIANALKKLKRRIEWALEDQGNPERQELIADKKIDYGKLTGEIKETMARIDGSAEKCKEVVLLKIAKEELEGNKIKQYQNYISSAVSSHFRGEQWGELNKFLSAYDDLRDTERIIKNNRAKDPKAGDVAQEMHPVESGMKEELFKKAGIQEAEVQLRQNYDSLSPNQKKIIDYKRGVLREADMSLREIAKLPKEDIKKFLDHWLMPALEHYREEKKKIDIKTGDLAVLHLEFVNYIEEIAKERKEFSEKGIELVTKFFEEAIEIEEILAKGK